MYSYFFTEIRNSLSSFILFFLNYYLYIIPLSHTYLCDRNISKLGPVSVSSSTATDVTGGGTPNI